MTKLELSAQENVKFRKPSNLHYCSQSHSYTRTVPASSLIHVRRLPVPTKAVGTNFRQESLLQGPWIQILWNCSRTMRTTTTTLNVHISTSFSGVNTLRNICTGLFRKPIATATEVMAVSISNRGGDNYISWPMYSVRGYRSKSSGQCTTKRSAKRYIMRPLRLRDLTLQKLSQNTVREFGRRPTTRRAKATTHTGIHVPAAE